MNVNRKRNLIVYSEDGIKRTRVIGIIFIDTKNLERDLKKKENVNIDEF